MVGNWGVAIIFTTSDQRILTFKDMNRTVGSEWATHSRIGLKDQVEYLRPRIQKVTFTIDLDFQNGINPRAMLDQLAAFTEAGCVFPLVIGGRRVGRHNWRITDLGEAWETIYSRGELAKAKVDVTMQEYL